MKTALELIKSAARRVGVRIVYASTLDSTPAAFTNDNLDNTGLMFVEFLNASIHDAVISNDWNKMAVYAQYLTTTQSDGTGGRVFALEDVCPGFCKFLQDGVTITVPASNKTVIWGATERAIKLHSLSANQFSNWVYSAPIVFEKAKKDYFKLFMYNGSETHAGFSVNMAANGTPVIDFGFSLPTLVIISTMYQTKNPVLETIITPDPTPDPDNPALKKTITTQRLKYNFERSDDVTAIFEDELLICGMIVKYNAWLGYAQGHEAELFNNYLDSARRNEQSGVIVKNI